MKIALRLVIGFFILGVVYKTPQFWLALLVLLLPFYTENPKPKTLSPVEHIYDGSGGGYFYQDSAGNFVPVDGRFVQGTPSGGGGFKIKEGTWDGR